MKRYGFFILLGILLVLNSVQTIANFSVEKVATWNWSPTEVVSTESTAVSKECEIKVDSDENVHIVWHDSTDYSGAGSDYDIFYKKWNNITGLWGSTVVVSTESSEDSVNPSIDVDTNGNVHVAWRDFTDFSGAGSDYDIFYKMFNKSEGSWKATEVVSTGSENSTWHPSLAADNVGNVHVVWADETDYYGAGSDYDIFYRLRRKSTNKWLTINLISTDSTGHSYEPSIVTDSSRDAHVGWHDQTDYDGADTDWDIFYKRKNSSIGIWGATVVVSTESTEHSTTPSIAVDDSRNTYVSWEDITDLGGAGTDKDIFYKRRVESTNTWGTTSVISTESSHKSENVDILIDKLGNIHIAWQDLTDYNGAGSDLDIFYKYWNSTISGWSASVIVSTEGSGGSGFPSLGVDEINYVHFAWDDTTNYENAGTDSDIFYKIFGEVPTTPTLESISPNPSIDGQINLQWTNIIAATHYYVYRDISVIDSTSNREPIAITSTNQYTETINADGEYHYAIVAGNRVGNSSISNSESVQVTLSSSDTTATSDSTSLSGIFSILLFLMALSTIKRKKQSS